MDTLNLVFLGFLDSKNFGVTIEKEKEKEDGLLKCKGVLWL